MTASLRIWGVLLLAPLFATGTPFASILDDSLDAPYTRPIARFDHDTHNELAELEDSCTLCHHLFDEQGALLPDESSEEMACSECHGAARKGLPKTEAAFHNRCKGCHTEVQKGPIACGECHMR